MQEEVKARGAPTYSHELVGLAAGVVHEDEVPQETEIALPTTAQAGDGTEV